MSLWGNRDSKTVAGSVTVTAANSTVVGVGTTLTNFAVGDFLHVGENDYVFTAIANATVATVRSATGGALVGAQSNSSYVVSEKPLYITYSQNIDADTVYGASTAELSGTSGVASVTITNAGSDYDGTPTVTFSAPPSGVTATGTATVAANAVTAVVMTNNGSGYVTAPTVTFSGANTTSDIATGTAVLQTSERDAVTHAGWVVRTEGTGGRAGRVQYETLVAMSSIQGDAEDDAQLPE
jgi:hypothetical protein